MFENPALMPPPPRIRQVASWILRLAIAGSCLGLARIMLEFYSPVNTLLYVQWGVVTEETATRIDYFGGWTFIVLGALLILWPHALVLIAVAAGLLVWAIASYINAETEYESVAIPAQATRYIAPLALLILWRAWPRDQRIGRGRILIGEWLLRIAAAATFAAHGLEAIWQHPVFKDYLIVAAESFLSADLPERVAGYMLYVIGAIDLLLALLILGPRWRWVAGYMAAWGIITAGARIVHGGTPAWHDFAIRLANSAVPLSLLILWWPAPSIAQSVQPAQDTSPRVQT